MIRSKRSRNRGDVKLDGIYHCLLSLKEETRHLPVLSSLIGASAELALWHSMVKPIKVRVKPRADGAKL